MSSEKEYILQGKYNRALNKIALLEEQLAKHTSVNLNKNSVDVKDDIERNDAAFLQEELFKVQEKLQVALEERNAMGTFSGQALEGEPLFRNKIRTNELIARIEDSIVDLKREISGE